MKPGPKPTPSAVLAARGSWRAKIRRDEPHVPDGEPTCPAHLSDAAKAEWQRLVKLLKTTPGLLKPIDADALALLATALARWADAEKQLQEGGAVVKSPSGYPIQNPYLAVANAAARQALDLLSRFGMTPADRARVTLTHPPKADDPKSRFFPGGPALRIAP